MHVHGAPTTRTVQRYVHCNTHTSLHAAYGIATNSLWKITCNCWNNSLWNLLSPRPGKQMSLEFPGLSRYKFKSRPRNFESWIHQPFIIHVYRHFTKTLFGSYGFHVYFGIIKSMQRLDLILVKFSDGSNLKNCSLSSNLMIFPLQCLLIQKGTVEPRYKEVGYNKTLL